MFLGRVIAGTICDASLRPSVVDESDAPLVRGLIPDWVDVVFEDFNSYIPGVRGWLAQAHSNLWAGTLRYQNSDRVQITTQTPSTLPLLTQTRC